jgi:hypothetical protein
LGFDCTWSLTLFGVWLYLEFDCIWSLTVFWVWLYFEFDCILSLTVFWVWLYFEFGCILSLTVFWVWLYFEFDCIKILWSTTQSGFKYFFPLLAFWESGTQKLIWLAVSFLIGHKWPQMFSMSSNGLVLWRTSHQTHSTV